MKNQFETFEQTLAKLQCIMIARRVQASDEPMRLNWKHFDIMALIKERQQIEPSSISKALHLSRSSTSKYLKYLESKDLIKKTTAGLDRRSHQVALTKQADDILENIYEGYHQNARLAKRLCK